MLRSICDNCTTPEIQIDAENCLIDLLLLKNKYEEAESAARKLPDICGIRDKAFCRISQIKGELMDACVKSERACNLIMFDYVNTLFYRAKALSDIPNINEETALMAWDNMTDESNNLIRMYLNASDLAVNGYENNPYCYLITSYTSKSNYLLRCGRTNDALNCAENAVNMALDMFAWAKQNCKDPLIMSDILFFAQHTPGWCYKWAGEESYKKMICNDYFKKCANKVELLSL